MSEWREFSRLPESPDYWLGLRERIDRAARPWLVPRTRRHRWLDAALVTAGLAVAAVIGLLIVQPTAAPSNASLQASLAPADPVALELFTSQQAPHISRLLPVYPPRPIQ